ncbi:SH3 domain-binding glutamic acid-rich-like protein 3 [Phaenicophaeus curvirostris]|uniref:SH3 domain-binding glutamic acid-rich-like protein 3 n=1 Tax=Phaenicophaeus curvirostris TaxID=33595 RepID=UPI0037F0A168
MGSGIWEVGDGIRNVHYATGGGLGLPVSVPDAACPEPPPPLAAAVTCVRGPLPAPPSASPSAGSGRQRSMSTLKVYSTSVTGSREIKSQQSEVTRILDGKNIKYELVDISQDNALREEMRAKAGNPKAIPPQIVNGDHYCGDYELFVEAVEQNTLQEFLKLA